MNSVNLTGRFVTDPTLKANANFKVLNGTIAVDRDYQKDGSATADFIDIEAWNRTADFISTYFRKGMKAEITGELRTKSYTDSKGIKRKQVYVLIEKIRFAESKKQNEQYKSSTSTPTAAPVLSPTQQHEQISEAQQTQMESYSTREYNGNDGFTDDDYPF